MTMMTTTATKVIQANNNNVPAAAYAAVRSVEEDNDNELIADTVHVSGFGDTIPEAADLTWQDDYYNGIPGVIGVFDPDATKAKRLLCIMGSVTLCLGVFVLALAIFVANAEANNGPHYYDDYYQNVEEKDGPSAFVLAFIVLGSVLGTFWMRLVVQFVEIHLAVTTEGVRLDIPLRSRVLRMVACSVQFFCIALPCFVCSQMPYFREDEDAYDAATSFRNWFLSFALIVLGLSLKRGIGPESLIVRGKCVTQRGKKQLYLHTLALTHHARTPVSFYRFHLATLNDSEERTMCG